jgi:hypothetical protein
MKGALHRQCCGGRQRKAGVGKRWFRKKEKQILPRIGWLYGMCGRGRRWGYSGVPTAPHQFRQFPPTWGLLKFNASDEAPIIAAFSFHNKPLCVSAGQV